jgi:hypothetical protein
MTSHAASTERIVELPATAAAAGIARRELAATPGLAGELGYKALLLASELIAVFVDEPHPGERLRLTISVTPERVRIAVAGHGPEASTSALLHSHEPPSLGGYGLQIVDRMADAWGTRRNGAAQMWFELTRA